MTTIEYSRVLGAGAGWTKVATPDGRTMTVKGDRAVRNNNPGNLEYGPFAKSMGAIGVDHKGKRARGFAVFATREQGLKAQVGWYAKEAKKHPDMTIGQAISKYAPSFENNTAAYTRALTKAGGITADTKLSDISPSQMESIISAQHAVEGNTKATAFDATTGARIATIDPRATKATEVASAPEATPPSGGLASFFSDPLGMSAQAAEQPGLAAIDKMAGPAQGLGALASSSFDSRYGAPSSAPARAAFDAIAQGRNLAPVQQQNRVASFAPTGAVNDIATPAGGYAVAEDTPHTARALQGTKSYSDPLDAMAAKEWGTQQAATVDLTPPSYDQAMADYEGWQAAKAARAKPSTVDTMPAGMDNPAQAAPALGAPKDVAAAPALGLGAYTGPTASLSPDMMAPGLMADAALSLSPENPNSLQPPSESAPLAYGPEEQTIDDPMSNFPAAPTPETTFPAAPKPPDEGITLKDVIGFALNPAGSIIGGLLGGKLGGLGALGGPAGMATAGEQYSAGSGLGGINQGMYGPRGATGYSRGLPGASVTSRGPNQGYDLTNQLGARTTYGPSGDIRANSGTNKAWGEVLGGLFGGESKKSDKDKAGKGKGLGGINGSGYSGNGLY